MGAGRRPPVMGCVQAPVTAQSPGCATLLVPFLQAMALPHFLPLSQAAHLCAGVNALSSPTPQISQKEPSLAFMRGVALLLTNDTT